jgi:hypothetical protein
VPAEPTLKRTIAFVDGQNLFYAAKKAYGYPYPNYDPKKLACAFPISPTAENRRGINSTDWIRIDRATYDVCLDPNDYKPKKT